MRTFQFIKDRRKLLGVTQVELAQKEPFRSKQLFSVIDNSFLSTSLKDDYKELIYMKLVQLGW